MLRKLIVAAALAACIPSAALAGTMTLSGYGPRVGFSLDPDQLVLGAHAVLGEVAPDLTFNPNVELGLGDNRTLVAFNFDLHYHTHLSDSDWQPYFGAGLGINFLSSDRRAPLEDESSTGVGGNLVGGANVPTRSGNLFFGELRLGLGDTPTMKLIAGWTFKH